MQFLLAHAPYIHIHTCPTKHSHANHKIDFRWPCWLLLLAWCWCARPTRLGGQPVGWNARGPQWRGSVCCPQRWQALPKRWVPTGEGWQTTTAWRCAHICVCVRACRRATSLLAQGRPHNAVSAVRQSPRACSGPRSTPSKRHRLTARAGCLSACSRTPPPCLPPTPEWRRRMRRRR
jgi:hypothetical protein